MPFNGSYREEFFLWHKANPKNPLSIKSGETSRSRQRNSFTFLFEVFFDSASLKLTLFYTQEVLIIQLPDPLSIKKWMSEICNAIDLPKDLGSLIAEFEFGESVVQYSLFRSKFFAKSIAKKSEIDDELKPTIW